MSNSQSQKPTQHQRIPSESIEDQKDKSNPMEKKQKIMFARQTKLINSPSQQDITLLRSAKSGSIKAKLNLQNTRLRVNIQNLNANLNLREQNEQNLKKQLDRYVQKLKKYKGKLKERDFTILRLMKKIDHQQQPLNKDHLIEHQQFLHQLHQSKQPLQLNKIIHSYECLYDLSLQMASQQPSDTLLNQLKHKSLSNNDRIQQLVKNVQLIEQTVQSNLQTIQNNFNSIQQQHEQSASIQEQIQATKKQLTYLTTQYQQQTQNWMQIQAYMEQKIQSLTQNKYELEDKNDNLSRKCDILELKIKSYMDIMVEDKSIHDPQQQIEQIMNASVKIKRNNITLNEQLKEETLLHGHDVEELQKQIQLLKKQLEQSKLKLYGKFQAQQQSYAIRIAEEKSQICSDESSLSKKSLNKSEEKSAYIINVKGPYLNEQEQLEIDELIEKYKQQRQQNQKLKQQLLQLQNQLKAPTKGKQNTEYYQLLQKQNLEQEEIISESYQHISDELERLVEKSQALQKQKQQLINLSSQEQQNHQQKIQQLQLNNQNMATVIMHLQEELSKYREDKSVSNECQGEKSKEEESLEASAELRQQHEKQYKQISHEYNDLVEELGQSNFANNFKLQSLQTKIKELRISLEEGQDKERLLSQSLRKQCKNCEGLTITNKQLLARIKALEMKGDDQEWENLSLEPKPTQSNVSELVNLIKQKNQELQLIKEQAAISIEKEETANKQLIEKIDKYLKEKQKVEKELITVNDQLKEKQAQMKGLYEISQEKEQKIAELAIKEESIARLIEQNHHLNTKLMEVAEGYQKLQAFLIQMDSSSKNMGYDNVEDAIEKAKNAVMLNMQLAEENTKLRATINELNSEKQSYINENNQILGSLEELKGKIKKNTDGSPQQTKDATVSQSRVTLNTEKIHQQLAHKVKLQQMQIDELDQQNRKYLNHKQLLNTEILKLIETITKINEQEEPQFSIHKLDEYEGFYDLMTLLKVKLQIYWSIASEKTTKMNEIFHEMKALSMECIKEGTQQQQPNQTQQKLQQAAIIEERYEELLAQLLTYEDLNKNFYNKLKALKLQTNAYKLQIQSSEEIPYNEELLKNMIERHDTDEQKNLHPLLKLCLSRISDLERNLEMLQLDFDKKNTKLDTLLKRQISFHSEKRKSGENSLIQQKKDINLIEELEIDEKKNKPIHEEKSYSHASVKVFREIEELTKLNEQVKEKLHHYILVVEDVARALSSLKKYDLSEEVNGIVEKVLKMLHEVQDGDKQELKKSTSLFDLEEDYIVSGSFKQKKAENQQMQQIQVALNNKAQASTQTQNLQQQINTKVIPQKNDQRLTQKNMSFLKQHKVFMDSYIERIKQLEESVDEERIYESMAENLGEDELQNLIFVEEPQSAVKKILSLMQANQADKEISSSTILNKQIQQIINSIYQQKTYLSELIHSNILRLLSSENNDEFLEIIGQFFSLLFEEENKIMKLVNRKDQCIREYGMKMQKVLMNKFSEDSGTDNSDLLIESSMKKITEFKTQYDVRKEETEEMEKQQSRQ